MDRKRVVGIVLLVTAALAISSEFVGFVSPGWLCLAFKYQHRNDGDIDKSFWSDQSSNSWDYSEIYDYDLKWPGEDDNDNSRQQTRPPNRGTGRTRSSAQQSPPNRGTGRTPNMGSGPSFAKQVQIYGLFQKWALKKDMSLPKKFTDFLKWLVNDTNNMLTLRAALDKFIKDPDNNVEDVDLTSIFKAWFANAKNESGDRPPRRQWVGTTVNYSRQADIYRELRSWLTIDKEVDLSLPSDYKQFKDWIGGNTDELLDLKPYIDGFMEMKHSKLDDSNNERILKEYIATFESWFKDAFDARKSERGSFKASPENAFDALAMVADMEWKVKLGIWYGKGCVVFASGEEDECDSTNAAKLGENGFDVGGMATWNDLRVETVFGLCAGIVGFVGTLLSVKPFCLSGRLRLTAAVGICGMTLSCILFLVPVTRIVSIIATLQDSHKNENEEMLDLQTPWAAAVAGTGACIALVTAGLLAFYAWAEDKQKWSKFDDNSAIVFKNENQTPTGEKTVKENNYSSDGTYDNPGALTDAGGNAFMC